MDPVSHAAIASAVFALAPPGAGPAVAMAVLAGAELPDADWLLKPLWGSTAYLRYHRGPSHGPVGVVALSLLGAGAVGAFAAVPFGTLWAWCLAGAVSHVAFDVLNNYGTQGLWPFSRARLALDWVPIIDLYLLGLIGLGWLAAAALPVHRRAIFAGVWLLVAGYVAMRGLAHRRALQAVARRLPAAAPADGGRRPRLSVHPLFLNLALWRYVVQSDREVAVGLVSARTGRVGEPALYPLPAADAIIAASSLGAVGQVFLHFARHPRAHAQPAGDGLWQVRWSDMRYEVDGYAPFTAVVTLDRQLNLVDEQLGRPGRPEPGYLRRRWQEETGQTRL